MYKYSILKTLQLNSLKESHPNLYYMCNVENNLASNVQLATHRKPLYSTRQHRTQVTGQPDDGRRGDDFKSLINIKQGQSCKR